MPATATPEARNVNGFATDPFDGVFRISVDMYHDMIEKGIFKPEDRIELLEGILVPRVSINLPHRKCKRKLFGALESILPDGFQADELGPVTTDNSEPEPDVMVLRGVIEDYLSNPTAKDTPLLVEISDTTLMRDRGWKKRIYALAGFPVYWIVNLIDRQIEVYTEPSGPAAEPDYGQSRIYKEDDVVPVIIDGREVGRIAVKDLLP